MCVCELTENPLCPDYSVQGSERKYLKLGSSGRKVVLFLSCSGSTGVVGYMGAIWLLCLDRDRGLIFMTVAEADKKQFYFFFFFFFVLQNDLSTFCQLFCQTSWNMTPHLTLPFNDASDAIRSGLPKSIFARASSSALGWLLALLLEGKASFSQCS